MGNDRADLLARAAIILVIHEASLVLQLNTQQIDWSWNPADLLQMPSTPFRMTPFTPLIHTITLRYAPSGKPPTLLETKLAISMLRSACAPGMDGITGRALKDPNVLQPLHQFLQSVWEQQQIPTLWQQAILIALPKNKGPPGPQNIRGITLQSVASKVLLRVILNRQPTPDVSKLQLVFQKAKSCQHAIHIVKRIIRTSTHHQMPLALAFVDIEKAFDNVSRGILFQILEKHGYDGSSL